MKETRQGTRRLMAFARRVRMTRAAKCWTQTELAEAVNRAAGRGGVGLDVDQSTVSRWEGAVCAPMSRTVPYLAEVMGVDVEVLAADLRLDRERHLDRRAA